MGMMMRRHESYVARGKNTPPATEAPVEEKIDKPVEEEVKAEKPKRTRKAAKQ